MWALKLSFCVCGGSWIMWLENQDFSDSENRADLKHALGLNWLYFIIMRVWPVGLQDVYDADEEQESLSFAVDSRNTTHPAERERERERESRESVCAAASNQTRDVKSETRTCRRCLRIRRTPLLPEWTLWRWSKALAERPVSSHHCCSVLPPSAARAPPDPDYEPPAADCSPWS